MMKLKNIIDAAALTVILLIAVQFTHRNFSSSFYSASSGAITSEMISPDGYNAAYTSPFSGADENFIFVKSLGSVQYADNQVKNQTRILSVIPSCDNSGKTISMFLSCLEHSSSRPETAFHTLQIIKNLRI